MCSSVLWIVFDTFPEICELIDWYKSVSFHSWPNFQNCTAYTITEANEALLPCSGLTLKWNFINSGGGHTGDRSKLILGLGISPQPSWPTCPLRRALMLRLASVTDTSAPPEVLGAHLTSPRSSCTITFTKFVWICDHMAHIHDLYKNVLCLPWANSQLHCSAVYSASPLAIAASSHHELDS